MRDIAGILLVLFRLGWMDSLEVPMELEEYTIVVAGDRLGNRTHMALAVEEVEQQLLGLSDDFPTQ